MKVWYKVAFEQRVANTERFNHSHQHFDADEAALREWLDRAVVDINIRNVRVLRSMYRVVAESGEWLMDAPLHVIELALNLRAGAIDRIRCDVRLTGDKCTLHFHNSQPFGHSVINVVAI